jgi:stress-induced morphogen
MPCFDRAFMLTSWQVQDVSGGCGSMYAINVTSEKFRGLSMIKQHRLVNEILGEEIKKWHGLQLRTKVPQ